MTDGAPDSDGGRGCGGDLSHQEDGGQDLGAQGRRGADVPRVKKKYYSHENKFKTERYKSSAPKPAHGTRTRCVHTGHVQNLAMVKYYLRRPRGCTPALQSSSGQI